MRTTSPVTLLTHVLIVGVLAGAVLGAAPVSSRAAGPRAADALDDALRQEVERQSAIVWSNLRPLGWEDFAGNAPSSGVEGARTVYSLVYGLRCARGALQFRAVAAFRRKDSWVLPLVKADAALSERTLEHEQTHFNLTEVYARRMRKYFAELYDACDESEADLQASADRFVSEERTAQTKYDDQTAHGLDKTEQRDWNAQVTDELNALGAFDR